jgi:CTP synthase
MLHEQMLDEIVCHKLGILAKAADLSIWKKLIDALEHPLHEVKIAFVGKYVDLTESYKSLIEAIKHAGIHTRSEVNIVYIDSENIEKDGTDWRTSRASMPFWCPAVSVDAVRKAKSPPSAMLAKTRCLISASVSACSWLSLNLPAMWPDMAGAHSTEFVQDTPYPVIGLITEWLDASGKVEKRSEDSDIGGTMRLGGQVCKLAEGSLAREIYGAPEITERHRHRYEVNNTLLAQLEEKGLKVSGRAPGTDLCEMVELPADVHPWFVGCQFHPEFTSNPRQGHPLFTSYVKAALANQQAKGK